MPTRDRAPLGSPCWADLWTSDVEGSRSVLQRAVRLGGPGAEPRVRRLLHVHPRRGAGGRRHGRHGRHEGQRHLEDLPGHRRHRQDRWRRPTAAGAEIVAPAMPVADLGTQAVLDRPDRAPTSGAWQPGTFPGFTVLGEHGAPSWFELHTRDYAAARRLLPLRVPLGDEASATATSSATRSWRPRRPRANWPGSWMPRASCPRARRPTGRSTGRSTTPTPPSPRSQRSAARWSPARGHPLRPDGHGGGPGGGPVQVARGTQVGARPRSSRACGAPTATTNGHTTSARAAPRSAMPRCEPWSSKENHAKRPTVTNVAEGRRPARAPAHLTAAAPPVTGQKANA